VRLLTTLNALGGLLRSYLSGTFSAEWRCDRDALRHALGDGIVTVLLASTEKGASGFIAIVDDYDLHHCVRGLRVIDLYVVPDSRGRAVAIRLLAHVAARAMALDCRYVRGEAVESIPTRRLFERIAIRTGDSFNVSGKALTLLAALRDGDPRDIARRLPTPAMNYE
jgi:GNAT superfamily N-acetyltransferase